MKNAGLFPRFLAWLIDANLLFLPVLFYVLFSSMGLKDVGALLSMSLASLSLWIWCGLLTPFYSAYFLSHFGGGIGKMILGLQVVDEAGKPLSFGMAFFRATVGYLVSGMFFGLGYLWIEKDPEKRAWHDMIVSTRVQSTSDVGLKIVLGLVTNLVLLSVYAFLILGIYANFSSNTTLQQSWKTSFGQDKSSVVKSR